jgi:hypothetical protein
VLEFCKVSVVAVEGVFIIRKKLVPILNYSIDLAQRSYGLWSTRTKKKAEGGGR